MGSTPTPELGRRERRKRQTRRALAEAALTLFDERGYEQTTVADIAAAADVSTRTFFSYFRSKDDVLFADTDERLDILWSGLANRAAGERPIDALRRVAQEILPATADELMGAHHDERTRALLARPEFRARSLARLTDAQRQMAGYLHTAFADQLSDLQAVAITGALVGVAVHSMQRGDPFDRVKANLLWTLDLISDALESFQSPDV